MKYDIEKQTNLTFNKAVERMTSMLEEEGYDVLTDIHKILKQKLGVNFNRYKILGAFDASETYDALKIEKNFGALLPCNIIVRELNNGNCEIAAVDPLILTMAMENPEIDEIALKSFEKLEKMIDSF